MFKAPFLVITRDCNDLVSRNRFDRLAPAVECFANDPGACVTLDADGRAALIRLAPCHCTDHDTIDMLFSSREGRTVIIANEART